MMIKVAQDGTTIQPRTQKEVKPWLPMVGDVPTRPGGDARLAFAEWLTRPENPFFARVAVNRIWANVMGRGIVDPVDDFHSTNPPSNAALLDFLADDFAAPRLRPQADPPADPQQPDLSAERRADIRRRRGGPAFRLGPDPPDRRRAAPRRHRPGDRGPRTVQRDARAGPSPSRCRPRPGWSSSRPSASPSARPPASASEGPSPRWPRRSSSSTARPSSAGSASDRNRLRRLIREGKADPEIVEECYLAALCRPPTETESTGPWPMSRSKADRAEAFEDVLWAILNAKEFLFQH